MTRTFTRRALVLGSAALVTSNIGQRAQAAKPVHLLVGAGAGSTPDIIARLVGDQLAAASGQSIIVEDRAGPGGIAAMQALVASPPDGHTLALAMVNQLVFNSYLFSKLKYDPLKDCEPISLLASNSFSIAVQKSFEANTFAELVAIGKAHPGKLAVGTSPPGTVPHVYTQVLMRLAGIEVTFVPFRSGLEALTGLMRGDIQAVLDSPAIMVPQVDAGAIKILTVTGREREQEWPSVPTIAEAGFPAAEYESWFGLVAPSGVASDVVVPLNRAIASILAGSEIRERFAKLGFAPHATSPDAFRALIRKEHARWGAAIRDAGIRLN